MLARQKAETALKARDEFISIASHELKTPITSLKLQVQLAARALEKGDISFVQSDRYKRFILIADTQIERLSTLIEDMLDVSRLARGKLSRPRERIRFRRACKRSIREPLGSTQAIGHEGRTADSG